MAVTTAALAPCQVIHSLAPNDATRDRYLHRIPLARAIWLVAWSVDAHRVSVHLSECTISDEPNDRKPARRTSCISGVTMGYNRRPQVHPTSFYTPYH
ncbi:hypothetical protein OG21DRAFT_1012957 [Imleria badia]|nr:hypothetical protein OG21DRAFT_1012957 [Imleria badia]